jgi:hypothetical protein
MLWKRLVKEGATCPRCGSTQENVAGAVKKLEAALRPLGIEPVLETQTIDELTLYNLFNKDQAQLCPGGVCEVAPEPRLQLRWAQGAVVAAFVGLVGATAFWVAGRAPPPPSLQATRADTPRAGVDAAEAERCKVPDFAKAIGHEQKWKLHNNCL